MNKDKLAKCEELRKAIELVREKAVELNQDADYLDFGEIMDFMEGYVAGYIDALSSD